MDEDELNADIAEAIGKATASICLQQGIAATLFGKGIITSSDLASIPGIAKNSLDAIEGLSVDARTLAESALRGVSRSWSKLVTRN